jgi:hypothetical protein
VAFCLPEAQATSPPPVSSDGLKPAHHRALQFYYPDGRIAVNVIAGDGIPPGLYTTFFRAKGRKEVSVTCCHEPLQ